MTPLATTTNFQACISLHPTTPGQLALTWLDRTAIDLVSLSKSNYLELLLFAKQLATSAFCKEVLRVGLASDSRHFLLTPMHGLSKEWSPILSATVALSTSDQGFLWTKSGPHKDDSTLGPLCNKIRLLSNPADDLTFQGSKSNDNLFAKLIRGEIEQWRIVESSTHVAYLTPFPNVPGTTVVVPRRHLSSNIFSLVEEDYVAFILEARNVAGLLQQVLGVLHIGLFFEGFEIDYAHIKLYPQPNESVVGIISEETPFFKHYPGYLTTQCGPAREEKEVMAMFKGTCKDS